MFDRHIAIALLAAGLTFAWAVPSPPPVVAETIHVSVRSSDLDLASQSGRAVLQGRIANAVARICGSHPRTPPKRNSMRIAAPLPAPMPPPSSTLWSRRPKMPGRWPRRPPRAAPVR